MAKYSGKIKELESVRMDRDALREEKNTVMVRMTKQFDQEVINRRDMKRDYERNLQKLSNNEEENRRFRRTLEDKNRELTELYGDHTLLKSHLEKEQAINRKLYKQLDEKDIHIDQSIVDIKKEYQQQIQDIKKRETQMAKEKRTAEEKGKTLATQLE